MNYIFNAEKIKRLLSDFYLATEIAVVFYDSDMNTVAASSIYSEYCKCVRGVRGCVRSCNLSNFVHMERAAKTREVVHYTCHAGLQECGQVILRIEFYTIERAHCLKGFAGDDEYLFSIVA